jgi:hypothetical protein
MNIYKSINWNDDDFDNDVVDVLIERLRREDEYFNTAGSWNN